MKILLLDADGVVLEKGEYFSEKFAREYNVPIDSVMKFFKGPFADCQTGTKDLKTEIEPYLRDWGWQGTTEEFLEYWFEDIQVNPIIHEVIRACRQQGIKCYMASNNECYRARRIEEKLGDLLDGYFFSADLKMKKSDPTYFELVSEQLDVPVKEIVFVDNEEKNVEAAREFGIGGRLFSRDIWHELLGMDIKNEFKLI
tara:strand:- start:58 stop:654 length:597 start_codon:yes stop_codon:yes gene_type:complete